MSEPERLAIGDSVQLPTLNFDNSDYDYGQYALTRRQIRRRERRNRWINRRDALLTLLTGK